MAIALHDRDGGYYARRNPLGAAGDFTTAPEISQIFGELIGLWCADCWRQMGSPDPVTLAEREEPGGRRRPVEKPASAQPLRRPAALTSSMPCPHAAPPCLPRLAAPDPKVLAYLPRATKESAVKVAGGIQITASHNPASWNGLKLFGPDGRVLPVGIPNGRLRDEVAQALRPRP